MALNLVSPDDFAALLNLMGKYQHLVDSGDEEGWADLFTPDGAFIGVPDGSGGTYDLVGREELKRMPTTVMDMSGGTFRHNLCSYSAEYGANRDEAFARYYVIATSNLPGAGTTVTLQVDVHSHLLRIDGVWKLKSNTMKVV